MQYGSSGPAAGAHIALAYGSSSNSSALGGGSFAPAGGDRAWEDLRREARRIEGELEVKLQTLSKLAAGLDAHRGGGVTGASPAPGGGAGAAGLSPAQLAAARAGEVDALLQRLGDVNDEMGAVIGGGGDARAHTLARHRDILAEYGQEFRRLEASVRAARDRAELLGGGETAPLLSVQVHSSSGALLRERTQLATSAAYVNDMLAQAESVSRGLFDQRRVFDGVQDKLLTVGERFPVVNGLLNAIRRKKSKDTLVLSAVIAACTFLMLLYILRK